MTASTGRTDLAGLIAAFQGHNTFLVSSHVGPDGDAIGSALALKGLLEAMGKRADVVLADAVPNVYRWLPGADSVQRPDAYRGQADAAILIDAGRTDRAGEAAALLEQAPCLIVIDHHLEEAPDGDLHFVDSTYAAAGNIVFELFETAEMPIPHEAAVCAYTALATDTGSFRYSNTDPRAHRAAAALIEAGVDVQDVTARVFNIISRAKFDLMQRVLPKAAFLHGGRVAYIEATAADLEAAGAENQDQDGLINHVRDVEGVDVAIFFKEYNGDATKVSFRSRPGFNAADVCKQFGGGGHAAAAGATLDMPLAAAREQVLSVVARVLESES